MDIFSVIVLLLSYRIQAVGAQMQLSPLTLTVLREEEARFTCTANTKWTVMVWMLNGTAAVTIAKDGGVLPSINPNVTAERNSASGGDSWVLVLKNTQRHNQGPVTCDLMGIDRKTASLSVQEKGSVKVVGDDKLAFKGQSILFECQAAGWYPEPTLEWQVDDKKVSKGDYNISSEESRKSLFNVNSNLSVTAAKSSPVDCLASVSALTTPLKSSVRLTVVAEVVQEEGDDCTVPLAVTASLSAVLLLLLLCICTVLWYRQRRQAKPGPREAIWFDQSVSGRSTVAEATGGKVNLGYSSEGPTGVAATHESAYNELIMAARRQMDYVNLQKVPDLVTSSSLSLHSESQSQVCPSEQSIKTVRRITTV